MFLFIVNAPHAHALTVSGSVYTDEGVTLGGIGKTIKIAVGTSTPPTVYTSTVGGSTWAFNFSSLATGTPLVVWIDGDASFRASLFTKASSTTSNITGLHLYQNRVIVSHEGSPLSTSTTNADLSFYDSDDDPDIQYTANSGALSVRVGNELHIATGKRFTPGGAVTIAANAGSGVDGTLHLPASATYTAGGLTTIGGNFSASSSAVFTPHASGTTFNATTTGKTLNYSTTTSLGYLNFSGNGAGYTFTTNATATDVTIQAGATVVAPASLTVTGNLNNMGTYTHNSGTLTMQNVQHEVMEYLAGMDVTGVSGDGTASGAIDSFTTIGSTLYVGKGGNSTACSQTVGSAIGCELMVFDISSTTNPIYVAGRDASGNSSGIENKSINTLTTVGSFLYVGKGPSSAVCSQIAGSALGCELMIFDISSTTNPLYVWGYDTSSGEEGGSINAFAVSGSFLYVGRNGDSTACSQIAGSDVGCELMVFDISSTTNPIYVAGRDASGSASGTGGSTTFSLTTSGNFLYVGNNSDATACSQTAGSAIGCELIVFDISSTTNPIYVAGRDASGSANGTGAASINTLTTVGSTLYTGKSYDSTTCSQTAGSAIGCELIVFDISSTTNPTYVAGQNASSSISASIIIGTTFYGGVGARSVCSPTCVTYGSHIAIFSSLQGSIAGSFVGTSALSDVSIYGGVNFSSPASTTDLTIRSGTVNFPSVLTVTGNYTNDASAFFDLFSSILYLDSSSSQTIEGTLTGTQSLPDVTLLGNGTKTFSDSASTTSLTIEGGSTLSTTYPLSIHGPLTNNDGTLTSSDTLSIVNGSYTNNGGTVNKTGGITEVETYVREYLAGRDSSGDASGVGSTIIYSLATIGTTLYVGKAGHATACSQTAGSAIGCELMVFDISSTTNPIYVAGRDASGNSSGTGNELIYSLFVVSSTTLYVGKFDDTTACSQTAGSAIGCEIMIFDISSTTNPRYVAGRDASGSASGTGGAYALSFATASTTLYVGKGRNATACSQTAGSAIGCELIVFDISSTTNPRYVAGRDMQGDSSGVGNSADYNSLVIVGNALYAVHDAVATACSQTAGSAIGCELMVFDISSTTNPRYVAGRDATGDASGIGSKASFVVATAGNALYMGKSNDSTACSQTAGSAIGCELMVFDISSTTNPIYVAGRDASGNSSGTGDVTTYSLTTLDSFLYVGKGGNATACSQTAGSAIGCEIMIFDISSTTNPRYVSGLDASGDASGTGSAIIYALTTTSDRSLYVGNAGNSTACSQTAGSAIGCELMSSQPADITFSGDMVENNDLGDITVNGYSLTFSDNASTTNFTINAGATVVAPAALSIAGDYTNNGSFTDNSGTVHFSGSSGQAIAGSLSSTTSDFTHVNLLGAGTKTFSNNASTTNFTIQAGATVVAPATLTIAGNYTNSGTFSHNNGTVYLSSTTAPQGLSGTLTNSSAFSTLRFIGATTSATTSGMVGKWMFEEGSGTTVRDASGSGNTGTLTNGPTWTSGKVGGAVNLDGSNDSVKTNSAVITSTANPFTLSAWVKPTTFSPGSANRRIISAGIDANNAFQMTLSDSGGLYDCYSFTVYKTGTENSIRTVKTTFPTNTWTQVTMVWTGSAGSIYVDGTLESSASDTGFVRGTDYSKLYIGARNNVSTDGVFPGTIDDVRIYNRALSASEISDLYNEKPKVLSSNASTTNLTIDSGVVSAPPLLSISGNYSNSGTFTHNAGTTTLNGTSQQTLTGTMTASSTFSNLVIANTSENGSTSQSVIFANAASTSDTFTMFASTSAQFPANATSTFQNISLQGSATQFILLRSSSAGTRSSFSVPGTQKVVTSVNVKDISSCPATITVTNGYDGGNNLCWSFSSSVTLSSGENQVFGYGQATTSMSTLTIRDGATPSITALNDIRILIATTSANMRWDTTDVTATFGGTASGKVANPVSYLANGSMLLIPVSSDFSASDTLTVSGLSYSQFGSISSSVSALGIRTAGVGSTTSATDDKIVTINGLMTLANHSASQVSDNFGSSAIENDTTLYAFNVGSAGENATLSDFTFRITGINGITSADFTEASLHYDNNSNRVFDAGDTTVSLFGSPSISGDAGTISLGEGSVTASTSRDYILTGLINNLRVTDGLSCKLETADITAVGVTTGTLTKTGSLTAVQHMRGGGGGSSSGGSSSAIGGSAPVGDGVKTGGSGGGGSSVDPNSGNTIGNEAGFYAPINNGSPQNSWTAGANSYASDGVYTTTSVNGARQTYGGFDFSVPTNNTITGFEVKIEASGSTAAGTISAKLSWDGGGSLTTAQTTGTLALTDGVFTLGSPSDTWGRVWTASELISFRLELIGNTSANTISVDAIQVKVYHQASGGGGRGGGMIYADPQHQYASVYSAFDAIKSSFDDFLRHLFWWLE